MKGMAIIRGVCAHYDIPVADFLGPRRMRYLKQARTIAANQMAAAGMGPTAIGRVMRRDPSTVHYWLHQDEMGNGRKQYFATRHAAMREARGGSPQNRKVSDEQRDELVRLHCAGLRAERNALQARLGVKRDYTTDIMWRCRQGVARSLPKQLIGPAIPQGPRGIRWTQPEARP